MKSQTHLKDNQAFTLFEILVVMSLVLVVGSFSLYFGIDHLRGYSFHGDRDSLVSALQHARALSVANICYGVCEESEPHGVYIESDTFILFQGKEYSSADHDYDIVTETNPNINYSGLHEIIFAQLSGSVSTQGEILLVDDTNGKSSTISIESEGRISWTN